MNSGWLKFVRIDYNNNDFAGHLTHYQLADGIPPKLGWADGMDDA